MNVTIVEPEASSIQRFHDEVAKEPLRGVNFDWRCQTFQKYAKSEEAMSDKFHIIICISSLYFLGDLDEVLTNLYGRLEDGGILLLGVSQAMYCEIGQEPDPASQNRYRWVIPVKDPCQCTEVRVGSLNTRAPCGPFDVRYYDTFLHSSNQTEIRKWLNCSEQPTPCASGTVQNPATSCSEILEVCKQPPSGVYYLLVPGNKQYPVYCEMPGGWARFGKGNMQSVWNYKDEDEAEINLDIISDDEIEAIKNLPFTDFMIRTDVTFSLQADDSRNPSTVHALYLPSLQTVSINIPLRYTNNNRLQFNEEGDRVMCLSGSSINLCGQDGLPRRNEATERLVVTNVYFGPRAVDRGATATRSEWRRNSYTWDGSFYYLLAK
ncbi:uncharacterized protein LOC119731954 [Patiria miniata]|uniref:Uncharacterized protein n=1 Tax=Patiria miniata TaxID=46514 RepID=A0A914ACL6_PATMI|nr:uncharacterized protein LOC119731954 [Patiria miniata]